MKTLVVIPTRNRPKEQLERTIEKVQRSARQAGVGPVGYRSKVLVIDNNDTPTVDYLNGGDVTVVSNAHGKKKSDAEAQDIGLQYADKFRYDVAVKWDDDLEPEGNCIHHLANAVHGYNLSAAGGLYPCKDDNRRVEMVGGNIVSPDGFGSRHAQFFLWGDSMPDSFGVQHLYSSFAYDVRDAVACGGWCTDYSPLCYRHETDFTLRMYRQRDPLLIIPEATATHMRAGTTGGTKSFTQEEQNWMREQDTVLFRNRMIEHGIDYHF